MKPSRYFLAALLSAVVHLDANAAAGSDQARNAFDMWLAAHNNGTRQQLQAFNTKYKIEADVEADLEFRDSMGRFRLLEIKTDTPKKFEALVLSDWDNALLTTIEIDPNDPLKVRNMQLKSAPIPEAFKPKRMQMQELIATTKQRLHSLESTGKLSGSFLVAKNGQVLIQWAGGLADREGKIPVVAGTRFRMASLGKMITAVAILQLEEAGKLSLDDTLAKHLGHYPNQKVATAITLRQLLNHTSGTGEVFGPEFRKISNTLKTHSDYWRVYAAMPLEFTSGTKDRYSNYGYILLGAVIEAVSGKSYYEYVEQNIYRPAAMTSTGSEPESVKVPGRANAYTKIQGKWTRETASLPWRGTAAGGGYTTVGDLLKFVSALTNQTLLSRKSLTAATTAQNHQRDYGYGFQVSGSGIGRQFGHSGGAPGANAALTVIPNGGYVVAGLSSFDPTSMANLVNFVSLRLPIEVATSVDKAAK